MKLDAQFENRGGKLFYVKDGMPAATDALAQADTSSVSSEVLASAEFAGTFAPDAHHLLGVLVPWKLVELSAGSYNEEYLASLRQFLKNIEAYGIYAVIIPGTDGHACGALAEQYTAAMCHAARRIKDCVSVAGFALPPELASDAGSTASFIEAMSVKHAQYVYFAADCAQNGTLIQYHLR